MNDHGVSPWSFNVGYVQEGNGLYYFAPLKWVISTRIYAPFASELAPDTVSNRAGWSLVRERGHHHTVYTVYAVHFIRCGLFLHHGEQHTLFESYVRIEFICDLGQRGLGVV